MASGGGDDFLSTSANASSSENLTPNKNELVQQTYNISENHDLKDDNNTTKLLQLPERIQNMIWKSLDSSSLDSLSQTCSHFRREIIAFQNKNSVLYRTLYKCIDIWLPLREYLDNTSLKTLRLVCKNFKTAVDFCNFTEHSLGSQVDVEQENFLWDLCERLSVHACIAIEHVSKTRSRTHIFNLFIQDLKRICTYLSETDVQSLSLTCTKFQTIVCEFNSFSFVEYSENLDQFYLMDLPSEVHAKIFSYCPAKDRTNLRLVSKLMQYQVDTLGGVQVFLNDLKWNWDRNCGRLPPAYSLILSNIENLQSINYFTSDYNRSLLTRLVIDGPLICSAFIHILIQCKNLQYIGLTFATQMASIEAEFRQSFTKTKLPVELCGLRAVDLKVNETTLTMASNIFRVHAWNWTNAFELMKPALFKMPNLTSVSICEECIFSHNLLFEVADKIVAFLAAHRYTLKFLSIILLGHCFRHCTCPSYTVQDTENELKELRLLKYSHDCDWKISRPFITVLKCQMDLEELSIFKLSDWEFYAGIISQNRFSLKSVTIEENLSPVIDLSVFQVCENLEYLWISQNGSSKSPRPVSRYGPCQLRSIRFDARLMNLDKLPVSLKSLHILDQTADTLQINSIPRRLKKLETLELQFLGSWNGTSFGLTTQMIAEILQMRQLNCLFLEEIWKIGRYQFGTPLQQAISEINLIPVNCSQTIHCFGCVLYGLVVAEKLPSNDFMPKWQERVSHYLVTEEYNDMHPPGEFFNEHLENLVEHEEGEERFEISDFYDDSDDEIEDDIEDDIEIGEVVL